MPLHCRIPFLEFTCSQAKLFSARSQPSLFGCGGTKKKRYGHWITGHVIQCMLGEADKTDLGPENKDKADCRIGLERKRLTSEGNTLLVEATRSC